MNFSEFYTQQFVQSIKDISFTEKNKIFVIIGQNNAIEDSWLITEFCDPSTFNHHGNDEVFNKTWFTEIFLKLNSYKDLHIISYAQFSHMLNYIDDNFFADRVIIVRDNSRHLFPLNKEDFIENTQIESIEERSLKMPIHHAEHYSIDQEFYYSLRLPNETFRVIDVFTKEANLETINTSNDEVIDLTSDNFALDIFFNQCIQNNCLTSSACVRLYNKQPISHSNIESLTRINYILQQFGGSITELNKERISKSYNPSDESLTLLKKYWGKTAEFRTIKVYSNPDANNEITELSQGRIVDIIIEEYNNSVKGSKTRDLFLTAPTGAGKSLLFQLPSFHVSHKGDITIVVSPLIALMKDQVNAIISERNFDKVAYLNSELSLIDREKVIENCHCGKVDVLYMSPELLMSYDISYFIGERKLGLIVIDEAHLITTWGRDFRVDYWFIGNHIRKIRKYHNMSFPMVAVTATAIYGGANDMVFDSMESLNMRNPHVFIGQVKRQDIIFVINNYDKFERNYEKNKLEQTIDFIKQIEETGLKTLIYTPYTKHVKQITDHLRTNSQGNAVGYYGSMSADQKEFSFREFKSGKKKIMISTKAFGMGVDISDIQVVYHHAPSGLLPDYVQEIGRVARKENITGFAALNYSNQDQRFTKALHGISALKQYQLKEVLKKIHKSFIQQNKNRNLLLSVDDFGHIFDKAIDLDQKVLTALMMIEKDYLTKSRFNVIVARPKKLFVKVYARLRENDYENFNQLYPKTSKLLLSQKNGTKIIEVSLDDLWYNHFSDKSFPVVKHDFYSGYLFRNKNIELTPQLKISFTLVKEFKEACHSLQTIFDNIQKIFEEYNGSYFNEIQFCESLFHFTKNRLKSEKISQFILNAYSSQLIKPGVIDNDTFLQNRRDLNGTKYRVFNNRYLSNFSSILKRLQSLYSENSESSAFRYVTNKEANSINYIRLGYFLEMLELGTFEIKGGENPMVFIRINDPIRIEKDANSKFYNNTLLSKTLDRHYLSNLIFDHFFLRSFTNDERWDFIEDYFLGLDIDLILEKHKGGNSNNVMIVDYLKEISSPIPTESNNVETRTNIHIFPPNKDQFYKFSDLLTIDKDGDIATKSISQWLAEDPTNFDIYRKKFELKIDKKVFEILKSKLKSNNLEYFKKSLGLNYRIQFNGYDGLVKAIVPYKDDPLKFYKWWKDNQQSVYLDFKNKIELLTKVSNLKPEVLTKEHKDLIRK